MFLTGWLDSTHTGSRVPYGDGGYVGICSPLWPIRVFGIIQVLQLTSTLNLREGIT